MTREEAIKQLNTMVCATHINGMPLGSMEEVRESLLMAIEALKQESMLEKIKADLEKLANDEWNTKVGSVSQGLECALEIIEAYQEGR